MKNEFEMDSYLNPGPNDENIAGAHVPEEVDGAEHLTPEDGDGEGESG